ACSMSSRPSPWGPAVSSSGGPSTGRWRRGAARAFDAPPTSSAPSSASRSRCSAPPAYARSPASTWPRARPFLAREAVEDMASKRMPGRQPGVVEVVRWVVVHAESIHDGTRACVGHGGEGDDLVEPERLDPDLERCPPGFGRETVPPGLPREPPADLD